MKFWKLVKTSLKGDVIIENFKCTSEWEEKEFSGDSLLSADSPIIQIRNKSGKLRDFLIGGTSIPVVSQKVKELLQKLDDVSYLEFIQLKTDDINISEPYWAINIKSIIKCLDYDKSEYTVHEKSGKIRKIEKMVLRDEVIGDRNIFYIEEDPVNVYISDKLKVIFAEKEITGYSTEELYGIV